jgi:hypothetical protein
VKGASTTIRSGRDHWQPVLEPMVALLFDPCSVAIPWTGRRSQHAKSAEIRLAQDPDNRARRACGLGAATIDPPEQMELQFSPHGSPAIQVLGRRF